jgi:hypothetical protein
MPVLGASKDVPLRGPFVCHRCVPPRRPEPSLYQDPTGFVELSGGLRESTTEPAWRFEVGGKVNRSC